MATQVQDNRLLGFLGLFTSLGTLLCCALPSLLVLVGLGATVASVLSAVPWLVSLSHHKQWVFAVSGALIAGNFFYQYRLAPRLRDANGVACSADDPSACGTASHVSRAVLWVSATIWAAGFFSAFVLGHLLARFG